ncbi:hypothetical protein [Pseudofrankia sp. DC12]|uniref:hypothetical protein n=1 Tax=Pseudofrankia sp. DC12 TaxID=683315 RepID=UPI000A7E7B40|nr:hypothetical protein [Pseudofrankia sp. DC12]
MDVIDSWTGAKADTLREALRMSNESFASHLGVAVRTVANWRARPDLIPKPSIQDVLDAALDKAPERAKDKFLLLLSQHSDSSEVDARPVRVTNVQDDAALPAESALLLPWTAHDTLDVVRELSEGGGDAMNRRSFLILSGTALTTPAHDWLIARPVDETIGRSGRVIEPSFVEYLGQMTDSLRKMDDKVGGGSLINVVRSQAAYVQTLLREGRYTDSVGRDLYATMAELLRLAGWLSFDAGRHGEAQRFFVAALRGAHTAGDRALGANVLGFMSCQAKDIGQFRDATRLADSARSGYADGSPTVTAILNMRAAQAYANVDDVTESRRAIDTALAAMGGTTPQHGEPAWSYWLDDAQINEQVGYCYMRLGDWPRAREHLLAATQVEGVANSREGVLRQALLADTYAQQGEPDTACDIASQAIDALLTQVDSARCVGHIQRVKDHLEPFEGLSCVQAFGERVRQLEAQPA